MARKQASRAPSVRCPRCGHEADSAAGPVNFCPGCGAPLRAGGRARGLVDRVIAERYRLVALVGEGGMGAVYRAEHIRMGKALALKVLRGDFARDPAAAERFLAEARMVSRLSHPHTIAVFDFGEIDGAGGGLYLAMEYVPGKDLGTVLRESGPLPEHRVADLGQQILGSLAEAHDAGIVHRDVKPGNVMLVRTRSEEDFVKVLDFGIAKLRDAGPEAPAPAGAIVGTPGYLAPEQARGAAVDARSDLYAVGCLLYELAAGRPPFVAPTPMAVVKAHLHDEPPPLAAEAGVSRRVAEVIHRALRKDPRDRFESADAMREALAAASEPTGARTLARGRLTDASGLPIARREDFAVLDRQVRTLRRGRVLAPAGALLLAAAAVAAWRWTDVVALAASHAPRLAAVLPGALRPAEALDGEEHEPNDAPADANPLPLPGDRAAIVRGEVGARAGGGDVDVYRLDVPAPAGRVLVAEWRAARRGDELPRIDVALALNRERAGEAAGPAPLVRAVDRGGPGAPERLVAAVEPGVHYLAVRERPGGDPAPAGAPAGRYVLEVTLAEPERGRELEPNDAPERAAGYAAWRELAARNLLEEGAAIQAETSAEDPDLFAVGTGPGGAPEIVVAIPEPGLALAARVWTAGGADLDAPQREHPPGFAEAGDGAPGHLAVVKLGAPPRAGEPALVQLRAAAGQGDYAVLALGPGTASGAQVLARVRALAGAGRAAPALELAAAFVTAVPAAAARDEVLLLAGGVAERVAAALPPEGLGEFDRASQLLGAAVLEAVDGKVRYAGAFAAPAR